MNEWKEKEKLAKAEAEKRWPGDNWTTDELQEQFEVEGFCYGVCVATRKSDSVKGSLAFTNGILGESSPRIYYGFQPAS